MRQPISTSTKLFNLRKKERDKFLEKTTYFNFYLIAYMKVMSSNIMWVWMGQCHDVKPRLR